MGEVLGVGVTHYPPFSGTDADMAGLLRRTMADPGIPAEAITLSSGQVFDLYRGYAQLASVSVGVNLSSAQWRIDDGEWRPICYHQ